MNIEEIRGFAIADKIAPFIFINSSDSDNPKLFTLIHELAHIFIGETGISDISFNNTHDKNKQNKIEVYCNKVASEFLIPTDIFIKYWKELDNEKINNKINNISLKFPVSKLALLVKAKSLNYIEEDVFNNFFNIFSLSKHKKNVKHGAPDQHYIKRNLNTKKFTNYVLDAYSNDNITLNDACNLLSIKPNKLDEYIKKV